MSFARFRLLTLLLILVLAALAAVQIPRLQYAFGVEAFFPEADAGFAYYQTFRNRFPQGEGSAAVVGLHDPQGVLRAASLDAQRALCRRLSALPQVETVWSLATLDETAVTPFGPQSWPLLDSSLGTPDSAYAARLAADPRFRWRFLSPDQKTTAILLTLHPIRDFAAKVQFRDTVTALTAQVPGARILLLGQSVTDATLGTVQRQELSFYTLMVGLVILSTMVIVYRRFWGVAVGFVSVILGTVLFFGLYVTSGQPLDLLGTLFPVLLLIIGTSDVVHFLSRYADERRRGLNGQQAVVATLRDIGLATFMTNVSTAVGFATLFTSQIPAIVRFGWWSAAGVMLTFVATACLCLPLLSYFPAEKLVRESRHSEGEWADRWVMRLYSMGRKWPRSIVLVALLLCLLSGLAALRIPANLHDLRDFPKGERMTQDYAAWDSLMQGTGAVEYALEAQPGHHLYEPALLAQVARADSFLAAQPEAGQVYSPATVYHLANRIAQGGTAEAWHLPRTEADWQAARKILRLRLQSMLQGLVTQDSLAARITVHVPDLGTQVLADFHDRFTAWAGTALPDLHVQPTGARYLIDSHQAFVVRDFMESLFWSTLILAALMALVYRQWRMIPVFLIPNLLPLLLCLGFIGLAGIELDPKVAIVFSIAFGIAADDTIHFIAKFQMERKKGRDLETALQITFRETGKALVYTTVFLVAGFATLLFSIFPPSFLIGLLLVFTLAAALIADLFLTPITLRWMYRSQA